MAEDPRGIKHLPEQEDTDNKSPEVHLRMELQFMVLMTGQSTENRYQWRAQPYMGHLYHSKAQGLSQKALAKQL